MAASFTDCRVFSDLLCTYNNPASFGTNATQVLEAPKAPITFAAGTGSGQCSKLYASQARSLGTGATETLDLTALTDPLGNAVNFSKVNVVEIVASSTNTTVLTVGAAGSNPFVGPLAGTTPTHALNPGDRLLWVNAAAGWATASANNLKVANASGATATYDIKIAG